MTKTIEMHKLFNLMWDRIIQIVQDDAIVNQGSLTQVSEDRISLEYGRSYLYDEITDIVTSHTPNAIFVTITPDNPEFVFEESFEVDDYE